jgi:hypothetical protein
VDGESPPNYFHRLLNLCEYVRDNFTDDIGDFVEPNMDLVLDCIVRWAADDYKGGCYQDIAKAVLFDPRRTGIQGWDNVPNYIEYIEYYVPYMIMQVDQRHWP